MFGGNPVGILHPKFVCLVWLMVKLHDKKRIVGGPYAHTHIVHLTENKPNKITHSVIWFANVWKVKSTPQKSLMKAKSLRDAITSVQHTGEK